MIDIKLSQTAHAPLSLALAPDSETLFLSHITSKTTFQYFKLCMTQNTTRNLKYVLIYTTALSVALIRNTTSRKLIGILYNVKIPIQGLLDSHIKLIILNQYEN
jgi:hypothetical protein